MKLKSAKNDIVWDVTQIIRHFVSAVHSFDIFQNLRWRIFTVIGTTVGHSRSIAYTYDINHPSDDPRAQYWDAGHTSIR